MPKATLSWWAARTCTCFFSALLVLFHVCGWDVLSACRLVLVALWVLLLALQQARTTLLAAPCSAHLPFLSWCGPSGVGHVRCFQQELLSNGSTAVHTHAFVHLCCMHSWLWLMKAAMGGDHLKLAGSPRYLCGAAVCEESRGNLCNGGWHVMGWHVMGACAT